jgi:hypothetical protein
VSADPLSFGGTLIDGPDISVIELAGLELSSEEEDRLWAVTFPRACCLNVVRALRRWSTRLMTHRAFPTRTTNTNATTGRRWEKSCAHLFWQYCSADMTSGERRARRSSYPQGLPFDC